MHRQDHLKREMNCINFANDIEGSQQMIEDHSVLRQEVMRIPVDEINQEGQKVLRRFVTDKLGKLHLKPMHGGTQIWFG